MSKLARFVSISALIALALFVTAQGINAATFTVTNANDSGAGSLRQAIIDANALAGADVINFDTAGVFSTPQTITLTSGQLTTDGDLTINGSGASNLTISGNNASRVFYISPSKTVTIDGITITNGAADLGGGIWNDHATLTISNSIVSGNSVSSSTASNSIGGGIYNDHATLTVSSSTVSGNSTVAIGSGGGIYNNLGNLMVNYSSIAGNSAGFGGGVFSNGSTGAAVVNITNSTLSGNNSGTAGAGIDNFRGTVNITNSTISTNSTAGSRGGGMRNFEGTASVINCTISGNSAANSGGGVYNGVVFGSATLTIGNSILNANGQSGNIGNDGGTVTSLGANLSSDSAGGFLMSPGDLLNADPMLGPLTDNGGPTLTHALSSTSPARNSGNNALIPAGVTTDQRGTGFARIAEGVVDKGAFEVQSTTNFVCPQPQGYWKNNPDEWPVDTLTLGSQSYTKSELLAILNTPAGTGKRADASLILAYQLIAAKLNAANGANVSAVATTIASADALLSTYIGKLPYRVKSSSANGQLMVGYGSLLDAFNKGTGGCSAVTGQIVIITQAAQEGSQLFGFTTTGTGLSNFMLVDDGVDNDATPNSITFTGLSAGSYTITENFKGSYSLVGITCSVQSGGTSTSAPNVPASIVTINLAGSDTVTCTFNNAIVIP